MLNDTLLRDTIALNRLYKNRLGKEHALLDTYGNAQEALKHIDEPSLNDALEFADKELEFIGRHNIKVLYYREDDYPYRLRECPDAPILLYAEGNVCPNKGKMVSIVGTRTATERGKDLTRRLVLDLARSVGDVTIISGLAYGIDVAAHKAALEAGIPTLIIPGHGLDRIYPSVHRQVAVKALENGGLMTEYPTGTDPERQNFIARNRIIAGLADAVVVVESKSKGGSLLTAEMAVDYNRDLFAFPGRPDDESARGCNALIRDNKAHLAESADDIIQLMQWNDLSSKQPMQIEITELLDLSETEKTLLCKLREHEDGIHVNNIVSESGLQYSLVTSTLVMLELKGVAKSVPGGVWRALK